MLTIFANLEQNNWYDRPVRSRAWSVCMYLAHDTACSTSKKRSSSDDRFDCGDRFSFIFVFLPVLQRQAIEAANAW